MSPSPLVSFVNKHNKQLCKCGKCGKCGMLWLFSRGFFFLLENNYYLCLTDKTKHPFDNALQNHTQMKIIVIYRYTQLYRTLFTC